MSEGRGFGIVRVVISLALLLCGCAAVYLVATGRLGAPASSTPSQTETASSDTALVEGKSLDTYNWAQLSQISNEIEQAGGGEASVSVAQKYGILDSTGSLVDQAKSATLSDGTTVTFHVAGVMHDTKSDGSGLAGLTFVSDQAIASRCMNDSGTMDGGWESSDMRSWLASDGMALLPSDLTSRIVAVDKLTNNTGAAYDSSCVTTTSDSLWLLSAREVVGDINWFAHEYGDASSHNDVTLNAEGDQYQLFSERGCSSYSDPQGALARTYHGTACEWSYRTPYQVVLAYDAGKYFFYCALDTGYPYGHEDAGVSTGVIVGFSL
ncbi:MAG: DUF6273 domain-containing protein [Atopobiaceae bacterium]|jgi:hypothetical protein|nr:DUF6273 domain-containing protein [Atopobiaceae bacterium]MCI2173169.1 DUF6273 domain-containing protein [Atopobiaceae bacterium]MCI2208262.1 DUF6273 domain-containing protein [Atopobiaceae bacterium]